MSTTEELLQRGILLKEVRRYDKAIKVLLEAIALDPGHLEAMRQLCICKMYLHKMDEAREVALQMLQVNPAADLAFFMLGEMEHSKDNNEEALKLVGEAIRINPSQPAFHAAKARYLVANGAAAEGVEVALVSLQLQADYPMGHAALGVALAGTRDFEAGIASIKKAIDLRPAYYMFFYFLAYVYRQSGDLPKAREMYRETLKLHPNHVESKKAMLQLEESKFMKWFRKIL